MPPAHQRIQITGTLGQDSQGGIEIFDFSMAAASGMSVKDLCTAIAPTVHDYWNGPADNGIPSSVTLTGVRVEAIEADGKVAGSYYVPVANVQGRYQNTIPTILSHAVTLETSTPGSHGRMVRGRFYPPASCTVTGSTASTTTIEAYANAWAGLVNGLNDQGANVSVASTTAGGQIAPVTGVSVDTVIDTVRRRKNHVTGHRSPVVAIP